MKKDRRQLQQRASLSTSGAFPSSILSSLITLFSSLSSIIGQKSSYFLDVLQIPSLPRNLSPKMNCSWLVVQNHVCICQRSILRLTDISDAGLWIQSTVVDTICYQLQQGFRVLFSFCQHSWKNQNAQEVNIWKLFNSDKTKQCKCSTLYLIMIIQ